MFTLCETLLIVAIIICLFVIYKPRDGFQGDPNVIFNARNILASPNSFKKFRETVCPKGSACVDATDYMDMRGLIKEDNFTIDSITNTLK